MDFLPVGSVVRLKDGIKKLLIVGRCQVNFETNELWDYLGCLYPEGILGEDMNFVFNSSDIDEICHRGFEDEEEKELLPQLVNLYEEYKK